MTDQQQYPMTPSWELQQQWREQAPRYRDGGIGSELWLIDRAAQWGYEQRGDVNEAKLQQARDQELEACCEAIKDLEWFEDPRIRLAELRATRRPKPPTLAEQGMEALRSTPCTEQRHYDALFAALNRLAELEDSNG